MYPHTWKKHVRTHIKKSNSSPRNMASWEDSSSQSTAPSEDLYGYPWATRTPFWRSTCSLAHTVRTGLALKDNGGGRLGVIPLPLNPCILPVWIYLFSQRLRFHASFCIQQCSVVHMQNRIQCMSWPVLFYTKSFPLGKIPSFLEGFTTKLLPSFRASSVLWLLRHWVGILINSVGLYWEMCWCFGWFLPLRL